MSYLSSRLAKLEATITPPRSVLQHPRLGKLVDSARQYGVAWDYDDEFCCVFVRVSLKRSLTDSRIFHRRTELYGPRANN